MRACKEAHELICQLLSMSRRNSITSREFRGIVLQFVGLDERGRQTMLSQLLYPTEHKQCSLLELMKKWKESKLAEGYSESSFIQRNRTFTDFFKEHHLATTDDFNPDTAHKFIAWRTKTKYNQNSGITSASVVKKELDVLKQLAKLAALHGYLQNGNLWDTVRVKARVGFNKKVVEPLSIEEQKNLLRDLRIRHEAYHDMALLFLITGIRLGEMDAIKPDCIRNNIIALHGEYVGKAKTTGKTSSASRNLPVCPTIEKLFERGNIFESTVNALVMVLKKHFKGIHLHRLRHTFAVNKLLAQNPLQMVSYQMGHATTGITSDLYGKFVPEHFKAGFEQTIAERKELLQWLEVDYFA